MFNFPKDMYLGLVNDAMQDLGYHHHDYFINIKPKSNYSGLIYGPAFTTRGRLVDYSEDYHSLDKIRMNIYKKENFMDNPIVVLESNDNQVAHSGDITSLIYEKLGAVGWVSDGNVRDIDKINKTNFQIYCNDVNPIDALDYWALTEFNVPIKIKGVAILPGDFLFCSSDGVIRVPKSALNDLAAKINKVDYKESNVRKKINNKNDPDIFELVKELEKEFGRW